MASRAPIVPRSRTCSAKSIWQEQRLSLAARFKWNVVAELPTDHSNTRASVSKLIHSIWERNSFFLHLYIFNHSLFKDSLTRSIGSHLVVTLFETNSQQIHVVIYSLFIVKFAFLHLDISCETRIHCSTAHSALSV
mmetsp:Transcript_9384/g.34785  ORF Transcript_9384/g.34785 Transcript_9384/m.34785 type:complete len:136 (+) Transcript_9384:462-869(+)